MTGIFSCISRTYGNKDADIKKTPFFFIEYFLKQFKTLKNANYADRVMGKSNHLILESFALLLFFAVTQFLRAEILEEGTSLKPKFSLFYASGAKKVTAQDLTEDIVLKPISHLNGRDNILYISFDAENPFTLQEESGKYTIQKSSYIKSSDSLSGNAAHFSRLDNKIIIQSTENSWPLVYPVKDFTVEMWLKPYHFYDKNEVFRKIGLLDGKRIGISISIAGEKIECKLSNLFVDANGERHSINLTSATEIKINRWTHVAVSYEAASGKVSLLLNDREEKVAHAIYDRNISELRFHHLDHSPFIIGEIYSGIVDEFRISSRSRSESFNPGTSIYEPLILQGNSYRSMQKTAKVISDVMSVPAAKTGKVTYRADEPEGSILDFRIRTSKKYFPPDTPDSKIAWKRIRVKADRLPAFKYIQWMAEMKSDPGGRYTPVLREVSIRYDIQKKPSPPTELKYVESSLNKGDICLEWSESPEVRLNKNAGYRIYYGLRSGNYTGKLFYSEKSSVRQPIRGEKARSLLLSESETHENKYRPQSLDQKMRGRIRQCITNEMVERNIFLIDPTIQMPLFRAMNTYYFSLSSWTEDGGESELSEEIGLSLKEKPDL